MKEIRNFICLLFIMICLNLNIINANSELKNDNNKINLMQTKISKIVEQRYTKKTIDITYLAMGEEVGHNHVYETKYDENNHWNECIICDKKIEQASHKYSEAWTLGDSCSSKNKLVHSCQCGYSYQTKNTRTHKGYKKYSSYGLPGHVVNHCTSCSSVEGNYTERHSDANGILGCGTGRSGTCSKCGTYISAGIHEAWIRPTPNFMNTNRYEQHGNICVCNNCGKNLASDVVINLSYNGLTIIMDMTVTYLWDMSKAQSFSASGSGFWPNNTGTRIRESYKIEGKKVTYHTEGKMVANYETTTIMTYSPTVTTNDGTRFVIHQDAYVIAEKTPPTISNISQRDITSVGGWATSKEITITGTENYCSSVNISVTDDDGNTYVDNANVILNNGNYSYSFIPQVEADENGRELNIIVKDSLGNTNTRKYTIYKIDNYSPTFVGDLEYLTPWSKSKDVTFYAQDTGIKNVKIGFNTESDLEYGDLVDGKYQREYTFIGDVYGQTIARVYAEDGLGNKKSDYIKIGNLDNTIPNITNINGSINKNEKYDRLNISIEANDINSTLGKSGSGVSHYDITTSNNIPDENSDIWQESNLFEITENGTYYVWAKDLVGNISNPKELVVDELTTKYKVKYYLKDINGNNILELEEEFTGKIGEEITPIVKEYNGYKSPEPQTIKINSDGTTVIEYYYDLIKGKITIIKVDKVDNTKLLRGAIFKVEKLTEDNTIDTTFTIQEKATGENGKAEFTDLLVGEYIVTEIKAPEGYELAKEPLKVSITNENIEINVTATDKLKLELPETGGKVIYIFVIIGISLVVFSLILKRKVNYKK